MAYTPTINESNYALTTRTEEIRAKINGMNGKSKNTIFTDEELARVTRGANDTRTDEEIKAEIDSVMADKLGGTTATQETPVTTETTNTAEAPQTTENEVTQQEERKNEFTTEVAEQAMNLFNANPKNAEKVAEGQAKVEQYAEENGYSLEKAQENERSILKSLEEGSENTMWYGLDKDYRTINPYDTTPAVEQTDAQKMYSDLFYAGQTASIDKLYATQGQALSQFRVNAKTISDMIWNMYGSAETSESVDRLYGYTIDSVLSSLYNVSPTEVAKNREMYKTMSMGKNVDNKSYMEALWGSFCSDASSSVVAVCSWLYAFTDDEKYLRKIEATEEYEQRELSDYKDRGWLGNTLRKTMPIVRQGLKSYLLMVTGSAIGSAIGSAVGLKALTTSATANNLFYYLGVANKAKNIGGTVGAYTLAGLDTFVRESGSLLREIDGMTDEYGNTVDKSTKILYATLGGVLNAIAEYATPDPIGAQISKFDFANVMHRGIGSIIGNFVANSLAGAVSESTEEFVQSFFSDLAMYATKTVSNNRGASFDMTGETLGDYFDNAVSSFAEAFFPSLFAGIGGSVRGFTATFVDALINDESARNNIKTTAFRILDTVTTPEASSMTFRQEVSKYQDVSRYGKVVTEYKLDIDTKKLSKEEKQNIKEQYMNEDGLFPAIEVEYDVASDKYVPVSEKDRQIAKYLYSVNRTKGFAIKVRDSENARWASSTISTLATNYGGDYDETTKTLTFDSDEDRENFITEEMSGNVISENGDDTVTLRVFNEDGNEERVTVRLGNVQQLKAQKEAQLETKTVTDKDGNDYEVFTDKSISRMLKSALPSMSTDEVKTLSSLIRALPANVQNDIIQKLKNGNGDIRDFIISEDMAKDEYKNNPAVLDALSKGRALSIVNDARLVLKDGKTRGKDVVHEVFHVLWNLYPEYRKNLVSALKQTLADSGQLSQLKEFYEENKADLDTLGNTASDGSVVGKVDSWESFLDLATKASEETTVESEQGKNTSYEELFARISTVILQDPSDTALDTLPAKLKKTFEAIVNKLKEIYTGLVGKSKHAPQTLEEAVLSVFNSNLDIDENGSGTRYAEEIAQEEEVRQKYFGTDQWLKAPNGKPTNLTERQWLQVRTPNFIKWFGDWINDPDNASVVRDENGEPLIVYHGSRSSRFSVFDSSKGKAFAETSEGTSWFTDSKKVAESYGAGNPDGLYEVFLNIRKPDNIDWKGDSWTEVDEDGDTVSDVNEYVDEAIVAYNGAIDGFVISNIADDDFNPDSVATDYVVLGPNQIKSATDNNGDFSTSDDDIRFSGELDEDSDKELIEQLENGPTVKAYRAMQVVDGKLYPPMAYKVKGKVVANAKIGKWYKATENPDIAYQNEGDTGWYFDLNKGEEGVLSHVAYNPYWHTSLYMLNDQFSSAFHRKNLVTVEVEVPESELTSGYRAEKAKDTVGLTEWHTGPVATALKDVGRPRKVILSRYCKVVRVIPESEVAQSIKENLKGTSIAIPDYTVTPQLREELEKIGVPITHTGVMEDYWDNSEKGKKQKARELRQLSLQLNMESNPSVSIDLLQGYHDPNTTVAMQTEFAQAIHDALVDEDGKDIIDRIVGLTSRTVNAQTANYGIGVYGGNGALQISVGQQNLIEVKLNNKGEISKADREKLDTSALLHAIFLRQDAVTWGYIKSVDEEGEDYNAYNLDIGRNLTAEEARTLCQLLNNEDYGIIATPTGAWIANFSKNPDEVFRKEAIKALDTFSKSCNDDIDVDPVKYDGNYISVNWEQGENGYAYPTFKDKRSNKTALYGQCYNELADKLQSVYEEFGKRFDWGNANRIPTVEDVTENSVRYSEELNDELFEEDTLKTQTVDIKHDNGDIFNVDNPKSLLNRKLKNWESLEDSDIEQLVDANIYIPESVLDRFSSLAKVTQERVDRATIDRILGVYPQLRDMAEEAKSLKDFLLKAKKVYNSKSEDSNRILTKYYNYSQTLSPTQFSQYFVEMYGSTSTTRADLLALKKLMSTRKVAKVTEDGKKITTVIANDTELAKLLVKVNRKMTDEDARKIAKQIRRRQGRYVMDLARTLVKMGAETAQMENVDFDPNMTSWLAIALGTEQEDLWQTELKGGTVNSEMNENNSDKEKTDENNKIFKKAIDSNEESFKNLESKLEGKEIKRPTVSSLMRTINRLENQIEAQEMNHNSWKNAYYSAIDQIRLLSNERKAVFKKLSKLVKLNRNVSSNYEAKAKRLQTLLMYTEHVGIMSDLVGASLDVQKAFYTEIVQRNKARNQLRRMMKYDTKNYDSYYIDPTMKYLYRFVHGVDKIAVVDDMADNEYNNKATKQGAKTEADTVNLVTYDFVAPDTDDMEQVDVEYNPNYPRIDLSNMPKELENVLWKDLSDGIKDGSIQFRYMTSEDLNELRNALALVKHLSKMSKNAKDEAKKSRRRTRVMAIFSAQYGFKASNLTTDEKNAILEKMSSDPNFGPNVLSYSDEDIEDYVRRHPEVLFAGNADDNKTKFDEVKDIIEVQYLKMQRVAETMDGKENGPLYENFFRPLFESYEQKKRWINKRQETFGYDLRTILGEGNPDDKKTIRRNKKLLNEEKLFHNHTLFDGTATIKLTGWEQIGAYIYSKNIFGFTKLIANDGNNLSLEEIARINPTDTLKFIDLALAQRAQNADVAQGQTNRWYWSQTAKKDGTSYYARDILNHVTEDELNEVRQKIVSGEIDPKGSLSQMMMDIGDTMIKHVSERENEIVRAGYDDYNLLTVLQENYFPLRALDDNLLLQKIENEKGNKNVSKGMLMNRQLTATYRLNLNPLVTMYSAIQQQEALINMSQSINDANWLMSAKGGNLKGLLTQKFGSRWGNYFEDYLAVMAGAGDMDLEDMDKLLNKFIGNIAVSRIGANIMVSAKQLVSLIPAMTKGEITPFETLKAFQKLTGNKKDAWKAFIEQQSPSTFYSAYNVEAEKSQRFDETMGGDNILSDMRETTMWLTEKLDGLTKGAIWIAKYEKEIQKGASVQDASFRATQLVQTTQSITDDPSLSKLQRDKRPLVKIAFMFTNDAFQTWNMITSDIPNAWKQGNKRKAIVEASGILFANAVLAFLAGGWLPDKDDEEDDGFQWGDFLADWGLEALGNVPVAGSFLTEAFQGFSSPFYQGPTQLANLTGMIKKQVQYWATDGEEGEDYNAGDYIDRLFKLVMEGGVSLTGGPVITGERAYKALFPDGASDGITKNVNSLWYMLGSKYGKALYSGD